MSQITNKELESKSRFYVYLLVCSDKSIYCGCTSDLENRLKEHNYGEGSLWTKMRRPVKLVYYETHETLVIARKRERQIKGWTKEKKIKLIKRIWNKK